MRHCLQIGKGGVVLALTANFTEPNSFRFYLRGSYSEASLTILIAKLNQLTKDAADLNHQDSKLPLEKRIHAGLLLAMRPWEFKLFADMRRKN